MKLASFYNEFGNRQKLLSSVQSSVKKCHQICFTSVVPPFAISTTGDS